jgi:Rhodopirellula transposase DDE domain
LLSLQRAAILCSHCCGPREVCVTQGVGAEGTQGLPHGCREKGTPEEVNVHDFIDPDLPRAVPYGVYDLTNNVGWASVGTDHDTASSAVNAIRRWWTTMGKERHPKATRLLITADGGGQQRLPGAAMENRTAEPSQRAKLCITIDV